MSTVIADATSVTPVASEIDVEGERIIRKVMWRLIPFIFICYVVSYLDRINVGFAALTMNTDLGLTATQFGWGAGLFFFGYFIFEVPSNLMMQRFGPRIWIARIMITWGVISLGTAFVVGPKSFALARFLLGLAEAGFTPGIYLYFTQWFPGAARAKATAAFLVGIPIANIIGSPISGAILQMGGIGGLKGWQSLLVLEALPAVLLGILCLFVLADRPAKAGWLNQKEKDWLETQLAIEQRSLSLQHGSRLRDAFSNWRVFALAAVNFCCIVGSVGIGMWLPQIVKGFGLDSATTGMVTAIPYVLGAVVMLLWSRLAGRRPDRLPYVVGALGMAAVALAVSVTVDHPILKMIAISITVASILGFQATFWAIPSGFLTGRAAAGGLALIVSIGNLGGFAGPFVIGLLKQATNSFTFSLLAVSGVLLLGTLIMFLLGDPTNQPHLTANRGK